MKNIFKIQLAISCLLLFSCSSESNESKQVDNEPIVTFQDSLSYTIGINIGQNLPETEINHDLLIEGLHPLLMEDLNNIDFRAKGFPEELVDNEPEEKGYEI